MPAANLFSFYFSIVGNEKRFCKDYYWAHYCCASSSGKQNTRTRLMVTQLHNETGRPELRARTEAPGETPGWRPPPQVTPARLAGRGLRPTSKPGLR